MRPRVRIVALSLCGLLIAAGVAAAIVLDGLPAALAAFVLIACGLVLATSLAFLEVGLSEDRARARDHARAERVARRPPRRPRLIRTRSHRRGLG